MSYRANEYDILVIGGGHAGCEAALAAARMGCRVAVAIINADTIGAMSCNPAVGGLAKGHRFRRRLHHRLDHHVHGDRRRRVERVSNLLRVRGDFL